MKHVAEKGEIVV